MVVPSGLVPNSPMASRFLSLPSKLPSRQARVARASFEARGFSFLIRRAAENGGEISNPLRLVWR